MTKRSCPHADVRFCPLYHAAHERGGLGCDDGKIEAGLCGIARGISYRRNVELLRVKLPGFVEQVEWQECLERRKEQRQRNLRLNGIH